MYLLNLQPGSGMEWAEGSVRDPGGKTEFPPEVVRPERAVEWNSDKMSCPSLRTVRCVRGLVFSQEKGRQRRRNLSRAGSGPGFSLVTAFSPWPFPQSSKLWDRELQNANVCSHLQASLQWPSVLLSTWKRTPKQNLLEQNTAIGPCGLFLQLPYWGPYSPVFLKRTLSAFLSRHFSKFYHASPRLSQDGSLGSLCPLWFEAASKVHQA